MINAQPKPRPRLLDKRKAKADLAQKDREERQKCHARSGGRCEVRAIVEPLFVFDTATMRVCQNVTRIAVRCKRRASQNHHLISGIGRRNRGRSILAAHRLDVCDRCHEEITGKVLVPVDGTKRERASTVCYERIR